MDYPILFLGHGVVYMLAPGDQICREENGGYTIERAGELCTRRVLGRNGVGDGEADAHGIVPRMLGAAVDASEPYYLQFRPGVHLFRNLQGDIKMCLLDEEAVLGHTDHRASFRKALVVDGLNDRTSGSDGSSGVKNAEDHLFDRSSSEGPQVHARTQATDVSTGKPATPAEGKE